MECIEKKIRERRQSLELTKKEWKTRQGTVGKHGKIIMEMAQADFSLSEICSSMAECGVALDEYLVGRFIMNKMYEKTLLLVLLPASWFALSLATNSMFLGLVSFVLMFVALRLMD